MINCNGYLYFNLCDPNLSKPKFYYQHRFVYQVFKGKIPKFFEVDHINNNKNDNRIKNLQILTKKKIMKKVIIRQLFLQILKQERKKYLNLLQKLQMN